MTRTMLLFLVTCLYLVIPSLAKHPAVYAIAVEKCNEGSTECAKIQLLGELKFYEDEDEVEHSPQLPEEGLSNEKEKEENDNAPSNDSHIPKPTEPDSQATTGGDDKEEEEIPDLLPIPDPDYPAIPPDTDSLHADKTDHGNGWDDNEIPDLTPCQESPATNSDYGNTYDYNEIPDVPPIQVYEDGRSETESEDNEIDNEAHYQEYPELYQDSADLYDYNYNDGSIMPNGIRTSKEFTRSGSDVIEKYKSMHVNSKIGQSKRHLKNKPLRNRKIMKLSKTKGERIPFIVKRILGI